jgi:limonene-1,2-epoxide hydrolase
VSQNTDLIDRFVAAWKRLDVDEIMDFFSDDAVYTNIPIDPPNEGKEAIRKTIEGFVGMATAIEFVVHGSAENPAKGLVMNERTDRFRVGDKWIEARVMGVFELRGGKIAAWRDYFWQSRRVSRYRRSHQVGTILVCLVPL